MSTGTFQFSSGQWEKEGGTAANIPVPLYQLRAQLPAWVLLLGAGLCPWLGDKEVLGRLEGSNPLSPLWRQSWEGVKWVWRGDGWC